MPSLDSCISNLYEPGNIGSSSGLPPTQPTLNVAYAGLGSFAGVGSLRCSVTSKRAASAQLAGAGTLSVDAVKFP
jgi:hypothetical protein